MPRVTGWLASRRDVVALTMGLGLILWAGAEAGVIFFLAAILIELVMLGNVARLWAKAWAAVEKERETLDRR